MATQKFIQAQKFRLAGSGVGATDTSITLQGFQTPDGTNITSGLLGTTNYGTLEPGTSREEVISFTGVTQNVNGTATLTGVTRGLQFTTPYTASSPLRKAHAGSTIFIMSNNPQLYEALASGENDETITGQYTFETVPRATADPVVGDDLTRRSWVLGIINGGTITADSVVVPGVAGETLAAGNLVYFDATDNEWKKVDADTAASVVVVLLGIAQGAGTDGLTISGGVLLSGIDENQTGLVVGDYYYASNTAGAIANSAGTTARVIGIAQSATKLYFDPYFFTSVSIVEKAAIPSTTEKAALAGGGSFGTPSGTNKYLTEEFFSGTGISNPVVRVYDTVSTSIGSSTTRFDITNPAGTTYRYTYDGTGTDPVISLANFPVGSIVNLKAQNFNAANNGIFKITAAGTNFFEVTNVSGVAESDKTIGSGYIVKSGAIGWTKPAGLKYIEIEMVGAGGGGAGTTSDETAGSGGAAAGYSYKLIAAASLATTEYFIIGQGGDPGAATGGDGGDGRLTAFGTFFYATGGEGSGTRTGGIGVNGDFNARGEGGGTKIEGTAIKVSGKGGSSLLGGGAPATFVLGNTDLVGIDGGLYGAGASGAVNGTGGDVAGGTGAKGVIILTEHYI